MFMGCGTLPATANPLNGSSQTVFGARLWQVDAHVCSWLDRVDRLVLDRTDAATHASPRRMAAQLRDADDCGGAAALSGDCAAGHRRGRPGGPRADDIAQSP